MSHRVMCCLLGVCCPAASAKRVDAVAEILYTASGDDYHTASEDDKNRCRKQARALLDVVDLAPKGTSALLRDSLRASITEVHEE